MAGVKNTQVCMKRNLLKQEDIGSQKKLLTQQTEV
jgi:hypothetical protein